MGGLSSSCNVDGNSDSNASSRRRVGSWISKTFFLDFTVRQFDGQRISPQPALLLNYCFASAVLEIRPQQDAAASFHTKKWLKIASNIRNTIDCRKSCKTFHVRSKVARRVHVDELFEDTNLAETHFYLQCR